MSYYKESFYAILIVAQLMLSVSTVQSLSSTSGCSGSLLSIVSGNVSQVHIWDADRFSDKLLALVVPACLSAGLSTTDTAVSLNLTYTIEDIPYSKYFIISGNISGPGSVQLIGGVGGDRSTTYMSDGHQEKSFVFSPGKTTSKVIVQYTTDSWTRGHGPSIELFQSRTAHSGCDDIWRRCSVTASHQYICLPQEWVCNGREECYDGIDESDCLSCCTRLGHVSRCFNQSSCSCTKFEEKRATTSQQIIDGCNGENQYAVMKIDEPYSEILPFWPMVLPLNRSTVLQFSSSVTAITVSFTSIFVNIGDKVTLDMGSVTHDLSSMRAGEQKTIATEYAGQVAKLNIIMLSPSSVFHFNVTYIKSPRPSSSAKSVPQGAAPCDDVTFRRSCHYHDLCFMSEQLCNDHMDCPNGKDEVGCGSVNHVCGKEQIRCVDEPSKPVCFTMHQRCDGNEECTTGYDEKNCDSTLCGTHNGTFLCTDNQCIFETWLCDKTKDCSDGADEQNCDETSLKVVTASVIGSLVCAIMIVIAVGCSCKLHTHRLYESLHQRSRYESPMTRITNELMRRTAPPPYAEAMQRSRPFEEVQSEYLAALELRQIEQTTDDSQGLLEDQSSIASASGTLDAMEGSLVEVEENAVSFRRNPNKPPETTQSESDQCSTNVVLEPKSDDETSDDRHNQPTSIANDTQTNSRQSRRQTLRRSSIDSDVSMLSRDSDDVALLS